MNLDLTLDTSVRPFRIDVPQTALDDLQERLSRTRWPDEIPGTAGKYGAGLNGIRELTDYWQNSYDWRAHEERINRYPQYMTTIDGASVHFLHVRSSEPDAFPLILTHGWPGSFVEFLDIIGPLTDPKAYGGNPEDAFHVVIPSMPGYGFSGPTTETGWNVPRIARAWAELMKRLGYERYGAQGGDWGSNISRTLAAVDPEHACAVHLNYLPWMPKEEPDAPTEEEARRISKMKAYLAQPAGHMGIQGSRPMTLAYALNDSPIGQLAWIADKFADWTDPRYPVTADQLLTNVMVYWLTGTAGSAARLYYENAQLKGQPIPCPASIGVAVLPYDLIQPVRRIAERQYTVVHWSEFDRGGHFAAMEVPDRLAEDLRSFFRQFRDESINSKNTP
ncbi:epoxide hydrolase family protein [Paenibacillus sp. VMFN-D1]|uniref:epoxide hydrolase family protein n=1 Tax=Paenibacillus sp. VMFN-D1 TaxID=2135608 RepID=UPI000E24A4CD|nr:epoxide hydrolase family protein [Paenibacillus sp. VMFN-D1]RED36984.1 pimeloyl-ACP methyl ester carboxylesterase [Paenibacillus sp. VMFN-D1]